MGVILAANEGFCDLLRMKEEELLGKMVSYSIDRPSGDADDRMGESRYCIMNTKQDTVLLLEITMYPLDILAGRVFLSSFTVLSRSKASTTITTKE